MLLLLIMIEILYFPMRNAPRQIPLLHHEFLRHSIISVNISAFWIIAYIEKNLVKIAADMECLQKLSVHI